MLKILFFPHVPYHADTFCQVIDKLKDHDCSIIYSDHLKNYGKNKAHESIIKKIALKNNITSIAYHPEILKKEKPDSLVVMCDWGGWPKRAVEDAKCMNIPTIGHIEGAQDYLDTHIDSGYPGKKRKPYTKVDYIFLMGEFDKQFFLNKETRITGSPRFDRFKAENYIKPDINQIGINCNFSYGLYADIAEEWIEDIAHVSNLLSLKYAISQHRGDVTNLSKYNIYKSNIYQLINESSILISRFSTVIIESLLLGCPAIYYNPHDEKQPTFLDPMNAFPVAKNRSELSEAIQDVLTRPNVWLLNSSNFINHHVRRSKLGSAKIFADELIHISKIKNKVSYYFPLRSYLRYFFEMIIFKLKL